MTDVDYLLDAVRRIAFRELTETVRVRADRSTALTTGGTEQDVTRPLGVPGRVEIGLLGKVEPNAVHDRAALVFGERRPSGARVHGSTIAGDRNMARGIDGMTSEGDTKYMTTTRQDTTIQYALMVDWEDGESAEIVPAQSFEHAERMAATIYAGHPCWTVGREAQPWRYVRRTDAVLTDEMAVLSPRVL